MAIQHGFDRDGGFIVLNTDAGLWWYAYPTSIYANTAHKKPDGVAAEMAGRTTFDKRLIAAGDDKARQDYAATYQRLFRTLNPPDADPDNRIGDPLNNRDGEE